MEQYIGCDVHKRFSVLVTLNEQGEYGPCRRVDHQGSQMREFLEQLPAKSKIGLEASGISYWVADEIERAGHEAWICETKKAQRRMEGRNKNDKEDSRGLAMLMRNGTFPRVWFPPRPLRDQREMLRLRMYVVQMRASLKNRVHGTLLRHNLVVETSDLFGGGGREQLGLRLGELPEYTRHSVEEQLTMIDFLEVESSVANSTWSRF